jgi:hypothetical protein
MPADASLPRPARVDRGHRFWTTLLCATVGVVACRRAPEPHFIGPLPSCYRLTVGKWKIPQDAKYPEQRFVPPTPQLLRLDPGRTTGLLGHPLKDDPWRRLRGESDDSMWNLFNGGHPVRVWKVEGDLLFAVFGTGHGGLWMQFRIVGDSLLGNAEGFSDVAGMEYPTAPAIGVRVSCPQS